MLGFERGVTESPDRESASRADEYTRNFLEDEALPTIWQELAFHRRFVPGITLAEVNALAGDWFPDQNRLVVVSAPDAAGVVAARSGAARGGRQGRHGEAARAVRRCRGGAGADGRRRRNRGTIVKTTVRPEAGITEWTLSNGATVVLKPTTLKEDQILFRATAPGGTSLASDADFPSARVADAVVPAGGVGQFNGVLLDKILAGKRRRGHAVHRRDRSGHGAAAARRRISRRCSSCSTCASRSRAPIRPRSPAMASQARSAARESAWRARTSCSTRPSTPRSAGTARGASPQTAATVDQWNLDKSLAFYKARFADASNFTFVFVGSFTPEAIKPFVETYLASLPATHAHETWRDLGIDAADRRRREDHRRRASRRRARWRSCFPGRSSTTTRTGWRSRR